MPATLQVERGMSELSGHVMAEIDLQRQAWHTEEWVVRLIKSVAANQRCKDIPVEDF